MDVEEIYDSCLISVVNHEQLAGCVKYPLCPTTEIGSPSQWSKVLMLELKDGGTFVNNLTLVEHLPSILELFSSFVCYETKIQSGWVRDAGVYDALPAMIINIAQHA
jgi:hypothetical protein